MQRLEIDEYAELVLAKGNDSDAWTEEEKARFSNYSNNWDGEKTNSSFEINYSTKPVLKITLEDSKIKSWTYNTGE
jgi:hypothetical protein